MNKLKLTSLAMATLALSSLTFTGCVTGTGHAPAVGLSTNGIVQVFGHDINPVAVATTLQMGANAGTIAALKYDPNSRAYLQAVEVILETAIQNGQYDPALLSQSLSTISVKEARDPNITAGITSAFALYSTFYGTIGTTKIGDTSPYLLPALSGIRLGIASGLAGVPVAPSFVLPQPLTMPVTNHQ